MYILYPIIPRPKTDTYIQLNIHIHITMSHWSRHGFIILCNSSRMDFLMNDKHRSQMEKIYLTDKKSFTWSSCKIYWDWEKAFVLNMWFSRVMCCCAARLWDFGKNFSALLENISCESLAADVKIEASKVFPHFLFIRHSWIKCCPKRVVFTLNTGPFFVTRCWWWNHDELRN